MKLQQNKLPIKLVRKENIISISQILTTKKKLKTVDIKPTSITKWKNITKYIKNDLLEIKYHQNYGIGRFYGDNTTFTCMKPLKHTLYKYEGCMDLDQVLGHLRIGCEFIKYLNLEKAYPSMFYYLNNREKVYEEMIVFYGSELNDKSRMKWIFNVMLYGGNPEKVIERWIEPNQEDLDAGYPAITLKTEKIMPFIDDFKLECRKFSNFIIEQNS